MNKVDKILSSLDKQHWQYKEHKQRMSTKEWKVFLLYSKDAIIYKGKITKLVAKNLGYGVVEVSKELLPEEIK